ADPAPAGHDQESACPTPSLAGTTKKAGVRPRPWRTRPRKAVSDPVPGGHGCSRHDAPKPHEDYSGSALRGDRVQALADRVDVVPEVVEARRLTQALHT